MLGAVLGGSEKGRRCHAIGVGVTGARPGPFDGRGLHPALGVDGEEPLWRIAQQGAFTVGGGDEGGVGGGGCPCQRHSQLDGAAGQDRGG